jgi:hypothetical protein
MQYFYAKFKYYYSIACYKLRRPVGALQ